ncbi:MAG: antibiotic biosynthesis monooxygenase [Acidobacteria bacterium]|nr:antibiotic biosynthesis monooxygenase [Acidobacteriota bacterium]
MSVHNFARFEPRHGMEAEVRTELLAVVSPTRTEPGCLSIHVYEAVNEPSVFFIHSEWRDEAAFDEHTRFPHTVRFVENISLYVTHPVKGDRTNEIA